MLSNRIRKLIGRINYDLFCLFWDFYYKYGSRCPPKKHYYKKWMGDPESGEWDFLHYGEFYEPVCFPFPFKINCIGCHGCASNKKPLLMPDRPKGPWKVMTTETFNKSYSDLFGKEALVELLFGLEKHNQEVNEKIV